MEHPPDTTRAERISAALGLLGPPWTSRILEILRAHGPMQVTQLTAQTPQMKAPTVQTMLVRMRTSALVTRTGHGCYDLTRLGQEAQPVQRALAAWYDRHFTDDRTQAGSAGQALARLRSKGTVEVLAALEQHGPLRCPDQVREAVNLKRGTVHFRMQKLLAARLAVRQGEDRLATYTLTTAAQQLAPVYAELERFGSRVLAESPAHDSRPTAKKPLVVHWGHRVTHEEGGGATVRCVLPDEPGRPVTLVLDAQLRAALRAELACPAHERSAG